MKSQAERQKALRERRIESGQQRRLNIWISAEAYDALTAAAQARGITRMNYLDELLVGLRAAPSEKPEISAPPPKTTKAKSTSKSAAPEKSTKKKAAVKNRSSTQADHAPIQAALFELVTPPPKKKKASKTPAGQGSLWDDLLFPEQ